LRYHAICHALELTQVELQRLRTNLIILRARDLLRSGQALPRLTARPGKKNGQDSEDSTRFWSHFAQNWPADIYVFDPMRSMHDADENDSSIENLLGTLRSVFPNAAVIVAHHMRKLMAGGREIRLRDDMRQWSDGARGSSAIKAHADVIVCQERTVSSNGNEIVHIGAFLKDGPDIEPFPCEETDDQSFCWHPVAAVPDHLQHSVDALMKAGGPFPNQADVVRRLIDETNLSRAAAYRHFRQLEQHGILVNEGGAVRLILHVVRL